MKKVYDLPIVYHVNKNNNEETATIQSKQRVAILCVFKGTVSGLLMTGMVSFRPKQRTGPFFKFYRCSNDFILQKMYFSRLMRVYIGLIIVGCLFLSFLLLTSEVQLCIDKSRLACCLFALRVVGAVLVVFLRRKICTILQPMGSKGRYLKKSTKPCWPIRSKETWTKYTPTALLSKSKLAWTARNTLFEL